jgi:hypothetical protein
LCLLFQTACWAKGKVNEKLFYYSISVAIHHREDTMDILLPPPYEVYPFLFVKSDAIQMAEKFRMKGKTALCERQTSVRINTRCV